MLSSELEGIMSLMDSTDERVWLHNARLWAAEAARQDGNDSLAEKIERREADDFNEVRMRVLMQMPRPCPDPAFIAAWDEAEAMEPRN